MRRHSLKAAAAALICLLLASGCTTVPDDAAPAATSSATATVAAEDVPVAAQPASAAPLDPPVTVEEAPITLAPLLPRTRLDPEQDAQRGDLWERVRAGFGLPEVDNDLVRRWEQYYAKDPAYVQRMTQRGSRYLFHIVEEVQRRGMPTELALLPFIESAFNPQAQSRVAASGMWQFMPATGKDFELQQNLFRDDRRSVLESTRAALDYLQRLHGMFGDWQLALAAYNWGQGNVMRAIERNRRAGLNEDYASLKMPQETREYVPKLQAMKNIVLKPEAFALSLPPLQNHPFFLSVPIERDIDVALAARLAGLTLEEFQQLNPQMNKPVILAAGTPLVLLPYDNANRFLTALGEHHGAHASWTAWVAPRNVTIAEAAKLVGIREDELREINRIPPRMLVKAGSTLLVPRAAHASDVSEHIADHASLSLAPEPRPLQKISFKAGRQGDSVAAVAKRYRVSVAQVASWNKVPAHGRFKAGQTVVVMLPQGTMTPAIATRATATRAAASRSAKATAARVAKPAATRSAKAATPAKHVAKARAADHKAGAARVRMAQGAQVPPR